MDCVLREFGLWKKFPVLQSRRFASAYFGGGTPSYLTAEQIRRLLGGLQERGAWEGIEEVTFECEPGTVTREKLEALKQMGVTRLMFGFQSLNDRILRGIGRRATGEEALRAYVLARELQFPQINLDLLAGLPGESDSSWQQTVEKTVALRPDCATIYQMELTYNSILYACLKAGRNLHLPDWPTKRRWLDEALRAFEQAGYAIGSGYMALRDPGAWRLVYTVEHFWHGADLLGLGESAFGYFQGVHYQNVDTFQRYTSEVAAGRLPLWRALRISEEEQLRRELILQLKTGARDAAYFRHKFGVELAQRFASQFADLQNESLATVRGDDILLTRAGLLVVDWLLPAFYLPQHVGIRYT